MWLAHNFIVSREKKNQSVEKCRTGWTGGCVSVTSVVFAKLEVCVGVDRVGTMGSDLQTMMPHWKALSLSVCTRRQNLIPMFQTRAQ